MYRYALMGVVCMALIVGGCAGGTGQGDAPTATLNASSQAPMTTAASASAGAVEADDPLAACDGVEPSGEPIEVEVSTVSYAFDPLRLEGPVHCQPFVIVFTNLDQQVEGNIARTHEHNIFIRAGNVLGPLVFEGETIGTSTVRYEVPGLPAGEHFFNCSLHAPMTGDLIVAEA